MKTVPLYSLFVAAGLIGIQSLVAQTQGTAAAASATTMSPAAQIAAAQANYDIWDQPSQPIGPNHRTTIGAAKTGSRQIVEIGTGMNYWNGLQWVPSNPTFVPVANGFVASQLQDPVQLAGDLYTTNAVTVRTPEGIILGSSPVAVALYDAASGNFAVIATITNCQATLVESNQVLYPDAFSGNVCASVVYTISQGTFHQDVVFTGPLDPAKYGFPRDTTRIQIITEFYGAPTPDELTRPLYVEANAKVRAKMASPDLIDHQLGFGRFVMTTGRAYVAPSAVNPNGLETPVAKEYKKVGDGTYLFESVPYTAIASALSNLPPCHPSFGSTKIKSTKGYANIPHPENKPHAGPLMAQASHAPVHGVVVDYVANIHGTMSGVQILEGDATYLVSLPVFYNGPTTIEGGAVIKYKTGTSITLNSTLTCKTGQYRPAIFTAEDDDTVGDSMVHQDGYQGHINSNGYANPALYAASAMNFTGFVIRYAQEAIKVYGYSGFTWSVSHAQIVNCIKGIEIQGGGCGCGCSPNNFNVNNCLFSRVTQPILGTTQGGCSVNLYVNLLNVTMDHASTLGTSCGLNLYIQSTNSIYASVSSTGTVRAASGNINAFFNDGFYFGGSQKPVYNSPFQTNGAGNYYLTSASGLRGSGTASGLPATLLADLAKRTTQPPVALPALMQISGNLTLLPQVPRYTSGAPDLGYYYPALDYTVAGIDVAGGNVTVEPGTAIAVQNEYVASQGVWTLFGFWLEQGSSFISHGTPTAPITFTSTKMVQEQPETDFTQYQTANGIPFSVAAFIPDYEPDGLGSPSPTLDFRFSNFYLPGTDYHIFGGWTEDQSGYFSPDSSVYLSLQDCNLYGGRVNLGLPYYTPGTDQYKDYVWAPGAVSLVNNLFDRVNVNLEPSFYWYNGIKNCDMQVQAYNNLLHGGLWFHLEPFPASAGNWLFEDNLFDKVDFVQDTSQPLDYDYNAYWPLTAGELANDYNYYPWTEQNAAGLSPTTTGDGFTDGGNEKILTSTPPYQTGPLGDYYLPTTTLLHDNGSRFAADAGLAQYTTQTSQTKDSGQVDIGLHYVATSSSTSTTPKDTDNDGVPDYVEDANGNGQFDSGTETDWQHINSTTDPTTGQPVADAYSTVYDDIDLSGNGLVGRIEKALGKNPLDPSNPLTLSQVITGDEPQKVTFEVPINYTTLTSIGNLELLIDGVAAQFQECDQASDGNCLLKWNTAFEPPGQHELVAEVILNGETKKGSTPDPTVLNGVGPITSLYSDDVCEFDSAFCTFDSSGATLYATTPACPNANYTIELQDANGNHIKWLPSVGTHGSTSTGVIQQHWDLTYDDGVTVFTGDKVKAVFNVTLLDPSSGTLSYWLSDASTGPTGQTEYFTVAFAWDTAAQAAKYGTMWNAIMGSVVNLLMTPCNASWCYANPYSSSFNAWDNLYPYTGGNPGHLQNFQPDVQNLLNSLGDGNTMNFYFDGHGETTEIGNGQNTPTSPVLSVGSVAGTLHNFGDIEGPLWKHPYRFVFLNACHTAENSKWAHAFGIPDRTTTQELANNGHSPQAFLGWDGSPDAATTDGDWNDTAQTYAIFWDAWMSEQYTLQQCIQTASNPSLSFPFGKGYDAKSPVNNFHLRIYGYAGIKRIGYDPDSSYDSSPYYR